MVLFDTVEGLTDGFSVEPKLFEYVTGDWIEVNQDKNIARISLAISTVSVLRDV